MPDDLQNTFGIPPIGHNNPPSDATLLVERLETSAADIINRASDLYAASARIPDTIPDEETAGRVAAFVKQITIAEKSTEDRRKAEKSVYDELGKAVQDFFKPVSDKLAEAKRTANAKLLAYQREQQRKADEERRRIEAEARKKREEAEIRAAEAKTDDDFDRAIAAEAEAKRTAAKAAAVAAPTQVRSSFGVTASVRKTLAFVIEDETAIPRQFLMVNEAAIKAHMKGAAKGQLPSPIPGVRFLWNEQMVTK